jgi:mono/diheme cytochrome c family protein
MRIAPHILTALAIAFVATACGDTTEPDGDDVDWMVRQAPNYLESDSWRRAELEASLWSPELPYASKRLAGYGLGDRGWDLLPVLLPAVEPVSADTLERDFDGHDLRVDRTPTTREEWLELGEQIFWTMPMRRDAYLEWAVGQPQLWDELGMRTNDEGNLRGVVRFRDARGDVRIGATCAMCHSGGGVAGKATRDLDLGLGRALFNEQFGRESPEYAAWGPGNVDVTDDGVTDALAIPNLFGVDKQSHLNRSGAVAIASPASLAIRFETQYIVGHSLEARPDRRLTWALAAYVLALEAPDANAEPATARGEELFEANCAGCHQPDKAFSGGLIPADALNSDPQAAMSAFRGTTFYKTPSLLGISQGGPFLHDSSVDSLEGLLEMGHPTGGTLSPDDRDHLLTFLNTL